MQKPYPGRVVLFSLLFAIVLTGCGGSSSSTSRTALPAPPPPQSPHLTPEVRATQPPSRTIPTPFPAALYSARISGLVEDAKSRSPIAGAVVTVGAGLRRARTDAYGHYSVAFPAGPAVALFVTVPGFVQGLAVGSARPKQKVKVNFALDRVVAGLPAFPRPKSFGKP